jgi:hypothetical protein
MVKIMYDVCGRELMGIALSVPSNKTIVAYSYAPERGDTLNCGRFRVFYFYPLHFKKCVV